MENYIQKMQSLETDINHLKAILRNMELKLNKMVLTDTAEYVNLKNDVSEAKTNITKLEEQMSLIQKQMEKFDLKIDNINNTLKDQSIIAGQQSVTLSNTANLLEKLSDQMVNLNNSVLLNNNSRENSKFAWRQIFIIVLPLLIGMFINSCQSEYINRQSTYKDEKIQIVRSENYAKQANANNIASFSNGRWYIYVN